MRRRQAATAAAAGSSQAPSAPDGAQGAGDSGPQPESPAGGLGAADPVLDPGVGPVPGFEVGELTGRGVGGEGWEAPTVVVGEAQLRTGVGPFAAD